MVQIAHFPWSIRWNSVVESTVGDRKISTKKVHERVGKGKEEPEFNNANDCKVVLV